MKLVITLTILALSASNSFGAALAGRMTLSSYLWNRDEIDSSSTRHLQNSTTLSLRLTRICGQDLDVSTTLRGSYDQRNQGDNVDDYRVHDFMARWRNFANVVDLTVGRQRVFWPTTSVALDGASADFNISKSIELGGYVGALTPEDGHWRTTNYDDGHAFGARLVSRTRTVGNVSLSFSERRHAVSYAGIALHSLASRVAGLDWRRTVMGFGSLYGHVTYDLPRQQLGRAQISARWDITPTLSVQTEYRFRRPSIAYNSIFWVFGESEYTEGRMRLHWRPRQPWTFTIGLAALDVSGDDAQRFDLGISHKYFAVMLHGKSGAAGNTVGVSGDVMYPLNERWTVRGGSTYSSYELFEDQADANSETATWGGVRWQAWSQSLIDLEVQYLTHGITVSTYAPWDESDFRLMARLTWWFFHRLGDQGGQS